MPIFQSMLPLYIQAVEQYIEMNKQRYRIFTRLFYFDEYKLCEAKLKSAEFFLGRLKNEMKEYKLKTELQFVMEMQNIRPPNRSASMPMDFTLSTPDISTPKTCASIGEDIATYHQVNNSLVNSATTPIFTYFKHSNHLVMPHPTGQIIRQRMTSNSLPTSPLEQSNHSQYLSEINSEDSNPHRSNNTEGFAHEQIFQETNLINANIDQITSNQNIPAGSEYSGSEAQENFESLLFITIKRMVSAEIDKIENMRLRPKFYNESGCMSSPPKHNEFHEHAEGSYDILLQTILDSLDVVFKQEGQLSEIGANIAQDDCFISPYRRELLFNLERYICIATFDKLLASHENITKNAENIFNLRSGFNSKNINLCKLTLTQLENIVTTVFMPTTDEQQANKTIEDFTAIINILGKIPNISKQYIQPFLTNLELLRKESNSSTVEASSSKVHLKL